MLTKLLSNNMTTSCVWLRSTYLCECLGPVAQSVQQLTTGWTVRDRIPVETRFSARPDRPCAHPASCSVGTGSFSWVKCGRGVLLTTHPLLLPRSWKSRVIPLPTLWATPGMWRDNFTYLYEFILYFNRQIIIVANCISVQAFTDGDFHTVIFRVFIPRFLL